MSDLVTIEITGLAEMRAAFRALAVLSPEELGIVKAVNDEAETMMGLSKREYVPVASGTLRASGQVDPATVSRDEVEQTLSYGGAARAYAFKTHENPRTGKTGGFSPSGKKYPSKRWSRVGQWKFLETPVVLRKQAYFDAVAEAVSKALTEKFSG